MSSKSVRSFLNYPVRTRTVGETITLKEQTVSIALSQFCAQTLLLQTDAVVNAKYYNIARMAGCRTVDKRTEGGSRSSARPQTLVSNKQVFYTRDIGNS